MRNEILPFWAGWALVKCSWGSFSFCESWPRRRQHPLACFLCIRVLCLSSSLSLSSWSLSSLTPASHFSHFALPLSVPPTYTHREKTLGAGYKKYSEKVTKSGICLLLLCSSVFCLQTKTFTAPSALQLLNALSETPYLSVTLTRSLSLAPSQTFPTPPSLQPPPPLLPSSSRSLSSFFIFHHHPTTTTTTTPPTHLNPPLLN